MIQDRLFPTNIFVEENFFDGYKTLESLVRQDYESNRVNWQSRSDLYKRKPYESFVKSVLDINAKILTSLQYEFDSFTITDMWSNILKPGETHKPHAHANNFLSVVYYPYAEETSGIVFMDPRQQANVIKPRKIKHTIDNSDVFEYNSKTNKIIIFPSWLQHFVPVNHSNKDRVSIAWNIQIKGKVGRSEDYQSAEF